VGVRLFGKVVRQYGCSLPRSAWHAENNYTRPISVASSVAQREQYDRHRQLIERIHEPAKGLRDVRFWHESEVPRRPLYRRYRGKSGSDTDIVKPTRLTRVV
jgi:hypothetical protein